MKRGGANAAHTGFEVLSEMLQRKALRPLKTPLMTLRHSGVYLYDYDMYGPDT